MEVNGHLLSPAFWAPPPLLIPSRILPFSMVPFPTIIPFPSVIIPFPSIIIPLPPNISFPILPTPLGTTPSPTPPVIRTIITTPVDSPFFNPTRLAAPLSASVRASVWFAARAGADTSRVRAWGGAFWWGLTAKAWARAAKIVHLATIASTPAFSWLLRRSAVFVLGTQVVVYLPL